MFATAVDDLLRDSARQSRTYPRIVGALEVPAAFALLTVDGEPAALAHSTASKGYRRSRRACNFRLPMNFVLTNTVELLIAAVIVAMLARRMGLPHTVGLVLAGVAIPLF